MKKISLKTLFVLFLLIGSGCLLVWAGNITENNEDQTSIEFSTGMGKPWDSLTVAEQKQVLSYWDNLSGFGNKKGVQLQIIRNTSTLGDNGIRNLISIDTTIVTQADDWMLFQSADIDMFYTSSFNTVLDRVQGSILILPPNPIIENENQIQQQMAAINPEDYFVSIEENDTSSTVHLENPQHLNLTSIDLVFNKSTGSVTRYSMVNPNYSADGGLSIQYDVQIDEKKLDKLLESEVLHKLWIDFTSKRTPLIKSSYEQFSITNLLQP